MLSKSVFSSRRTRDSIDGAAREGNLVALVAIETHQSVSKPVSISFLYKIKKHKHQLRNAHCRLPFLSVAFAFDALSRPPTALAHGARRGERDSFVLISLEFVGT